MGALSLHEAGDFEAAGQRRHLLLSQLLGLLEAVVDGSQHQVLEGLYVVGIDRVLRDGDGLQLLMAADLAGHRSAAGRALHGGVSELLLHALHALLHLLHLLHHLLVDHQFFSSTRLFSMRSAACSSGSFSSGLAASGWLSVLVASGFLSRTTHLT